MRTDAFTAPVDTRLVFRIYAVVVWVVGAFLYAWGGLVFPTPRMEGIPYSEWLIVRVAGAVLAGVGFLAIAIAHTDDDDARRKALGWWALGHVVVLAGLGLQEWALIGFDRLSWGGLAATGFLLAASLIFVHLYQTADDLPWSGLGIWRPASVLDEIRRPSTARLRSTYEAKIREAASQEERHRLARDLHDSIKQQIFVMHTAAATAQARFDSDQAGARTAVEQVRASAREAMAEMEAMLDQLRASPIENTGLIEALKKQCEALGFRTGAEVTFSARELPPSETLPVGAQQTLLRIAQEALANIGRHARATHVTVTLDSTPLSVQLRVDDDGVGFDNVNSPRGMGLGNMRSRAEALGGRLAVTSQAGKGTLVRVSIPYGPAKVADLSAIRNRVVFWGTLCAFWLFMVIGAVLESRTLRLPVVVNSALLAWHAVVFARVTATYLRARKAVRGKAGNGGTN
jgi:signal transduction histidine kinase